LLVVLLALEVPTRDLLRTQRARWRPDYALGAIETRTRRSASGRPRTRTAAGPTGTGLLALRGGVLEHARAVASGTYSAAVTVRNW